LSNTYNATVSEHYAYPLQHHFLLLLLLLLSRSLHDASIYSTTSQPSTHAYLLAERPAVGC